jgi:hypothetical protein
VKEPQAFLPAGLTVEASQVRHQADGCRSATAESDASADALPDAGWDAPPEHWGVDAEKWADRAPAGLEPGVRARRSELQALPI